MIDTYRTKAEAYAAALLVDRGDVAATDEGLRLLIATAWLEGSLSGAEEAVAYALIALDLLAAS